jgi:hypothetical protein
MCQKSFQNVDRSVEGRTYGAALCFTIPTAIVELLTEKARDDPFHIVVKVNTERDGSAIYAGFYFATEKRLSGVFPTALIFHECNGPVDPF